MKADLTRDTFDRTKHFSRVLSQQGRVTLDADQNEQSSILLHYLRTLARDLIGPYAAPVENPGFRLSIDEDRSLSISSGRIYVDGILVENDADCPYDGQPDLVLSADDPLLAEMKESTGQAYWLYLDVWERHVTSLEDDSIRESALGGPDTCTRAKVVWQVKALPVEIPGESAPVNVDVLLRESTQLRLQLDRTEDPVQKAAIQKKLDEIDAEVETIRGGGTVRPPTPTLSCDTPLTELVTLGAASLAARVDPGQKIVDPCVTSPDSKYRGAENQLYRVEIHQGGTAGSATFKWSRDNGSVATAWLGTEGSDLQVANTRGFKAGSWVELSDDALDLQGTTGALVKLTKVDGGVLSVDPQSVPAPDALAWGAALKNPKIRRWDQTQTEDVVLNGGGVPVSEPSETGDGWIALEDGIQVQFTAGGVYRSGDYWLIPARVATGQIEWPQTTNSDGNTSPDALAPDGVEHHYVPLGFVAWMGQMLRLKPCHCDFEPLSSCYDAGSVAVGAHMIKPIDIERMRPQEKEVLVATKPKLVKSFRKKINP